MKKKIVIFIILLAFLCLPSSMSAYMMCGGPGGGGGGAGTWYYPTGLSETSDTASTSSGWAHATYVYGGRIQAGQSGTSTQIAVKLGSAQSGNIKIGLYDDSNSLLGQCSTAITAGTAWFGCTISISVTSGTYYKVFYSADADAVIMRYTDGQTGWFGTCAYASAMCNPPTSIGSEGYGYMARMCVGGTCT